MRLLPEDERALQDAVALAQAAVGLASPNPTVGCVLMLGGRVLGQGAHVYDGRDHAEITALKAAAAAGQNVRGATAYVTLEPCAHYGRTGPCADALLQAGVSRCVAATVDPNPLVRGQGFAKLRSGGVEVLVANPSSALAQRARRLNDAFAFAIQHRRPFVTLKAALSVDGMLAPPVYSRATGKPYWLTGPAAREDVQGLRHASDAILTGIGTVLADDPALTDRTGLSRRRPLLRVVLDPGLRTPLTSELVRSASKDLLVIGAAPVGPDPQETSHVAEHEARAAALQSRGAEVVLLPVGPGGFDLAQVLALLQHDGRRSLLLEGGAGVNGAFLTARFVDRAVLYYSETELGSGAVPFARGAASPYTLQAKLSSPERMSFPNGSGEDARVSGYLHDPWAGVDASGSSASGHAL